METYLMNSVAVISEGTQIALLPKATVILNLDRIEVNVDELPLSSENIGLLRLACNETLKELTVIGNIDNKTLKIKRAFINSLTFCAEIGKAPYLKDIYILGLSAEWGVKNDSLREHNVQSKIESL